MSKIHMWNFEFPEITYSDYLGKGGGVMKKNLILVSS